jgi:hypothetical protein
LFCHSLQFLDDYGLERLTTHTLNMGAERLITVVNTNDDLMGEVLAWADSMLATHNAERTLVGFPPAAYQTVARFPLIAKLRVPDFDILTSRLAYLLDTTLRPSEHRELKSFLLERLAVPEMEIKQEITAYKSTP